MVIFLIITLFFLGLLYIKRLIYYKLNKEDGSIFNILNYVYMGLVLLTIIMFIMFFERRYSIITVLLYSLIYLVYIIYNKYKKK